jgi:hypothetical protein
MTRTVQDIFKDLEFNKKMANTDLENVSYNMRPGFAGAIIQAKAKLADLSTELAKAVIPSRLVGLFAKGDTEQVAKFFNDNGSLVVDANETYKAITNELETTFTSQRLWSDTQYSRLISELRNICTDQGYKDIAPPKQTEEMVPTYQDHLFLIKRLVRGCVGDAVAIKVITDKLIDKIAEQKMESRQIAVLVIGVTSSEEKAALSALFTRSVDYTFSKGYVPNKVNIQKILKQEDKETE